MGQLKKYSSFEGLKSDEKTDGVHPNKDVVFSEFEVFLKKLQKEYSNKKRTKTHNGKQPNR
jgi:hypothetical protein